MTFSNHTDWLQHMDNTHGTHWILDLRAITCRGAFQEGKDTPSCPMCLYDPSESHQSNASNETQLPESRDTARTPVVGFEEHEQTSGVSSKISSRPLPQRPSLKAINTNLSHHIAEHLKVLCFRMLSVDANLFRQEIDSVDSGLSSNGMQKSQSITQTSLPSGMDSEMGKISLNFEEAKDTMPSEKGLNAAEQMNAKMTESSSKFLDDHETTRNMNTLSTSLISLQSAFRDAEVEIMCKRDAKKYKWIPISSINEILESCQRFDVEDTVRGFIFAKAKRLFSLLVRQEHFEWLSLFHSNDFGDENFPINFSVDRISNVWALKSCKTDTTISFEVTEREVNGISASDQDSLATFCDHHQWLIFVPIFSPDDEAHVFDPLCRMPFVEEFESQVTNFSIVRHFVIHRSHLNFPRDDQIVRLRSSLSG